MPEDNVTQEMSVEEVVSVVEEQLAAQQEPEKQPEQIVEDPLNNPAVNQAAKDFNQTVPRIKALAKSMSRNSLARVYGAVVEFPLANKYPRFKRGTKEEELFIISLHALGAKNIMHNAIMQSHQLKEQIYDEIVDGSVEEIVKENENVVEDNRSNQREQIGESIPDSE